MDEFTITTLKKHLEWCEAEYGGDVRVYIPDFKESFLAPVVGSTYLSGNGMEIEPILELRTTMEP